MSKIKVGIVYGGKSSEHEVSVRSAESIDVNLDRSKYEVTKIYFDKENNFDLELLKSQQVIFPIIHGTYGEDGRLQGLLETLGLRYVGCGVTASALAMDKNLTAMVLKNHGVKMAYGMVVEKDHLFVEMIEEMIGYPMIVKPTAQGSSVGVRRVDSREDLIRAVNEGWRYGDEVIVEEYVNGRELEVAVIGNSNIETSGVGEIIPPKGEIYSYEEKYSDVSRTKTIVDAELSLDKKRVIRDLASQAYKALGCRGMARVDMFMRDNGEVLVNEVNTLPGFTSISMFPKLWEAAGMKYGELLDRLIDLSLDR